MDARMLQQHPQQLLVAGEQRRCQLSRQRSGVRSSAARPIQASLLPCALHQGRANVDEPCSTSSSVNAAWPTSRGREPWGSRSAAPPQQRRDVRAFAAVGTAAAKDDGASSWMDTLVLGAMFASWYISNIVFNIYNKQVLKAFPFPLTITTAQFFVGTLIVLALVGTGAMPRPKLSKEMVLRILPLAVVHTLGNVLTNVSLGAVAVSFTHTIKATEPIFSVALSAVFLGDKPHPLVLATLLPIMGGVALASLAEATFNWAGFISAMGSNLTFQSRNVLSKKLMIKGAPADPPATTSATTTIATSSSSGSSAGAAAAAAPLDNISLFSVITCISFALLLPVNLLLDGWKLSPASLASLGVVNPSDMLTRLAVAGVCFHAYQQVSYMILARVSPVTHSIGNCVKRVVVIVSSVLFFRNPMTAQSAAGTTLALLGVFAYSQAKRLTKPKAS